MKKKTENLRHKLKTHLIVESLESRLVLSASGVAFGGLHDGPDFEPRERHDREAFRPALIGARFEGHSPGDRHRHDSPEHFGAFQPRGRDSHREERFDDHRFDHQADNFSDDLTELATPIVFVSPSQPASSAIRPLSEPITGKERSSLFDEPLIRRPTITVITPTIPTSLASTPPSAFDNLGTSLTVSADSESTFTSPRESVLSRIDNSPTIVSAAPAGSRGTTIGWSQIESALFDRSFLRQVEEAEQNDRSVTFFSISASQPLDWQPPRGTLDGATDSDATEPSREPTSHPQGLQDPEGGLDGRLASSVDGEGGLINIDFESRDDSVRSLSQLLRSSDLATIERTSTQTLLDALWHRFADRDLDFGAENETADELAEIRDAEVQAVDEEAVALDEGGMIVLTSTTPEDMASARGPEVAEAPTVEQVEILIEPAIGVFHAVEVATPSVEDPDNATEAAVTASDDAPATESAAPPSEQSAELSDHDEPLSMRCEGASISMVVAIASCFIVCTLQARENDYIHRDVITEILA